jgi:hypothetical protein
VDRLFPSTEVLGKNWNQRSTEKAGFTPVFLFVEPLLFAWTPSQPCCPQQPVDGLHAALEIGLRSSYVPEYPLGVQSPVFPGGARLNAVAERTPGIAAWMK